MKYPEAINKVYAQVKDLHDVGEKASYIPELAYMDENKFGIHISTIGQIKYGIGDFQDKFSIQSISKVFSLCMAYGILGEAIWERVGVEPSGTAFNSLILLETDNGIPRNPFINSGSMVICDILISHFKYPKQDFLDFVRMLCDNQLLEYSERIADSERKAGYRNIALCNFIKSFDNIKNEPEDVLDFYFNMCSLEMNCEELSQSFNFLANAGCKLSDKKEVLTKSKTKRINALMQTCGFYDESGEFTFKVGLPGKSGVGGGIIAVHPKKYSIAVWSPRLNKKGNSYKGMRFLEEFTTLTKASIF